MFISVNDVRSYGIEKSKMQITRLSTMECVCLFELMLNVPVYSCGHVGTLPLWDWMLRHPGCVGKDTQTSK